SDLEHSQVIARVIEFDLGDEGFAVVQDDLDLAGTGDDVMVGYDVATFVHDDACADHVLAAGVLGNADGDDAVSGLADGEHGGRLALETRDGRLAFLRLGLSAKGEAADGQKSRQRPGSAHVVRPFGNQGVSKFMSGLAYTNRSTQWGATPLP